MQKMQLVYQSPPCVDLLILIYPIITFPCPYSPQQSSYSILSCSIILLIMLRLVLFLMVHPRLAIIPVSQVMSTSVEYEG
jgi:hypothetical protein